VRLLPRPDLVVNLDASPATVVGRKDELTPAQVEAELAIWPRLPVPRLISIDAERSPAAVADDIRARLGPQR
jgi:hypothetical protein